MPSFPRLHLAAAASLALIAAQPAAARTAEDEQVWVNLTVTGGLADPVVYFVEVQPRIGDGVSRLDALLLRGAVGVKVTGRLTLYQGYAHVVSPVANGRNRNEERSFQQATWYVPVNFGELQSRTRLEQRWRNDGDDTGWRLRQMLRYELPVKGTSVKPMASVEGFVHLNDTDWGTDGGFDQLRSFVGVEVPLVGKTTAELGYLNQVVDPRTGPTRVNHVASISVFFRH